jgi:hypothetical protein
MISAYLVIGITPLVFVLIDRTGNPHTVLEGTELKEECWA